MPKNVPNRNRLSHKAFMTSDELITLLEDNVDDYAIFITNSEGHIINWNRGATSIFGYEIDEVLGKHASLIFTAEDRDQQVPEQERTTALESGKASDERWHLRKDGSRFWASGIMTALRAGDGRVRGFVKILRDMTDRKRLEEQLIQAQKMESVGQLAGGIAHDFNNLLTAIHGYMELAAEELPAGHEVLPLLNNARLAVDRAANLTSQLLAFARRQKITVKVLDVNSLVSEIEQLLRRLIGENIEIVVRVDPDLGHVKADSAQLMTAVINLATNARDAMPEGGKLFIEAANVVLDHEYALTHLEVTPGDYVQITVSDTGTGMEADVQSHVFEPFFTTKEVGKGTGLGLATVYGIIKQCGGHIEMYSEPGLGTTFKIYLPRVHETIEEASTPHREENTELGGTETVLLVEDEPMVLSFAAAVLRARGYNVLEALLVEEALRLGAEYTGEIDLIVSDVVMPRMSGPALIDQIKNLRPDVKVIYTSGYTDKSTIQGSILESCAFLQKPYTTFSLARKVREMLNT